MKILETPLSGVFTINSKAIADQRGSFERLFCDRELEPILQERVIRQINQSVSTHSAVIRGMHYQKTPHAEMKLIRCLKGRVWDVALDLRRGSPTLFQWFAQELSPDTSDMIVIPEGVAHGFQTLEPDTHLLYLHTEYYYASSEAGVAWNDPLIAIDWPTPPSEISKRDQMHPFLEMSFQGVSV
jgi:dTDP-4-dehydrorhamnose 3,5-epimerase